MCPAQLHMQGTGRDKEAEGIPVWNLGGREHCLLADTGEWIATKNQGHIVCVERIAAAAEKASPEEVAGAAGESGQLLVIPIYDGAKRQWQLRSKSGPCDISRRRGVK